jgi:hypothetical protein
MNEETQPLTPAELLAKSGARVVHGPRPETFADGADYDWKRLQALKAQEASHDSGRHALALAEARDHIESLKAQIGMMQEIIDQLTAQEEEESEADHKKRCL